MSHEIAQNRKMNYPTTNLASIISCLLVFSLVAVNLPFQLGDVVLQGGDEVTHLPVDGPCLLVGCQVLLKLYPEHLILLAYLGLHVLKLDHLCSQFLLYG